MGPLQFVIYVNVLPNEIESYLNVFAGDARILKESAKNLKVPRPNIAVERELLTLANTK